MATSEGAAWRKFLKSLVGAAVLFCTASAGYFEYQQRQDSADFKKDVAAAAFASDNACSRHVTLYVTEGVR